MKSSFQNVYRSEGERHIIAPEEKMKIRDDDAMILLPLILLLMTEKADKMLLFALLYILM